MNVREKLIATATRLFHNQGYNSTGINQIIEEAGIAKGSFYYNFKSKEELCIAYLNHRHEYWFSKLKEHIQGRPVNEGIVLNAFDFLESMNQNENFRGCSFLNILSELNNDHSKILQVIQNHKNDLRAYLLSLLNNPEIGDHIYLLFESAIIESQLYKNQWPIKKAKKIVESLIE